MHALLAQRLELPGENPVVIKGELDSTKFASVGTILTNLIPYIFVFAGLALLLMIVSAGFTLLTSAGDAKKMEAGKNRLTYAVVGFFIIFIAYWGVQVAGIIFGFESIKLIFK